MIQTVKAEEAFTTEAGVKSVFPMHLGMSATGNKAAQEKARAEYSQHVDKVFVQMEGDLLANAGYRDLFMRAANARGVHEHVLGAVAGYVRKNRSCLLSHSATKSITEALCDSLWDVWRNDEAEQK